VLGERVQTRILLALPLVCSGVLLISGALESGAYGENPTRGVMYGLLTGLTYAGFILVLRQAGSDLRRTAGPLFDTTLVSTVVAVIAGVAVGEADLVPAWPAHGWLILLALSSQVLGWLLIAASLPRLPAALTSVTLTIQPVGSVLLGMVLLGEDPSALQLAGVACILAGLVSVALRRVPQRARAVA
jgi:drug/metabolite transporter (DMT)-like permease